MTLTQRAPKLNPPESEPFQFAGFSSPNTTAVPDEFFDLIAPNLSEAELRVALYIIRRTFGFKKRSDDISLKQLVEGIQTKDGRILDRGAGVAKSTAWRGVKGLVTKGIIESTRNASAQRGDEATTYALRFHDPVFRRETPPVSSRNTPRVSLRNTQHTEETIDSMTRVSNISKTSTCGKLVDNDVDNDVDNPSISIVVHDQPLVHLISDFSREMGDIGHIASNVTQAHRIMGEADVDIETFFDQLYEARNRTRKGAGIERRMAYFFTVLRDQLELSSASDGQIGE